MTLFEGPDYDSDSSNAGDGLGVIYSNWEANSITSCTCDSGYFGPDCSMSKFMYNTPVCYSHHPHDTCWKYLCVEYCPRDDDPLTENLNNRNITLVIDSTQGQGMSGQLGITFLGVTTYLDLTSSNNTECQIAFEQSIQMGSVYCTYTHISGYDLTINIQFVNWPVFSAGNNILANLGAPSASDFYCDVALVDVVGVECTFTDTVTSDLKG